MSELREPEKAAYSEVARCPMDFAARARRESPVVELTSPDPDQQGFLVLRYKDIADVCRDTATFSSVGNPQSDGWGVRSETARAIYEDEGHPLARVLVWVDPPEHVRFRRISEKIFAASRIDARAGHVVDCLDKLIGQTQALIGDGPEGGVVDIIETFTTKYPAMVMTREFNSHEDDYPYLIEANYLIGRTIEFTQDYGLTKEQIEIEAARAAVAFQAYMDPRIEAVRAQPNNTMLSDIVNAEEDGKPALTTAEVHSVLIVFLLAAVHSTAVMSAWVLKNLADRPEVQARLRREPEKIPAFVEEALRLDCPVATSFRTATADAQIAGVQVPEGSQVHVRWQSGNRDGEKWENPEEFDLDRKGVRGHMAFGSGVHFCVGNPLARRELTELTRAFLDNFSTIAPGGEPGELESFGLHGLTELPLRLVKA